MTIESALRRQLLEHSDQDTPIYLSKIPPFVISPPIDEASIESVNWIKGELSFILLRIDSVSLARGEAGVHEIERRSIVHRYEFGAYAFRISETKP